MRKGGGMREGEGRGTIGSCCRGVESRIRHVSQGIWKSYKTDQKSRRSRGSMRLQSSMYDRKHYR